MAFKKGTNGQPPNFHHTQATKNKLSKANLGKVVPQWAKDRMKGPRKQFCVHGHDTFLYGRHKANGNCVVCSWLRARKS